MDENQAMRKTGIIVVDSREQNETLKAAADEVRLLRYDGPGGEVWSYDIEVTTEAGQILRYERKMGLDMVGSFDKIERQLGPCDGLILEGWAPRSWLLTERGDDPRFARLVESTRKRIWRLAHSKAIISTENVADTITFLKYAAGKRERIGLARLSLPNPQPQPDLRAGGEG